MIMSAKVEFGRRVGQRNLQPLMGFFLGRRMRRMLSRNLNVVQLQQLLQDKKTKFASDNFETHLHLLSKGIAARFRGLKQRTASVNVVGLQLILP